jgi:ankyrin repeat protein
MITSKELPNMKKFNDLLKTVNLEDVDKDGNTALLLAADNGRLTMMRKLVKAGANIHHRNNNGEDFYDLAKNLHSGNHDNKWFNNPSKWIEKNLPEFVDAKKYNL